MNLPDNTLSPHRQPAQYTQTQEDMRHLVACVNPEPGWHVLDIAAGGGNIAPHFAPHVAQVITARLFRQKHEIGTVTTQRENPVNVDADSWPLPLRSGAFHLVVCRNAMRYIPDGFRFVQECARVLKPDGLLLIQDVVLPENDRAARYIDSMERLRDPDYHHAYAEYEWRGLFLDAGLAPQHVETLTRSAGGVLNWAARKYCSPEIVEKLIVMLAQAPQTVTRTLNPRYLGTPEGDFDRNTVIISGKKD